MHNAVTALFAVLLTMLFQHSITAQPRSGYQPGQTFSAAGSTQSTQPPVYMQPPAAPVTKTLTRAKQSTAAKTASKTTTKPSAKAQTTKRSVKKLATPRPSPPEASNIASDADTENASNATPDVSTAAPPVALADPAPAEPATPAALTPEPITQAPVVTAPPQPLSQTPPATASATPERLAADSTPITEWPTGKNLIALTYDDGPDVTYTPALLDYLEENKVAATFYVCGNRIKDGAHLVARMHEKGFELANHTYSHPSLPRLSEAKVEQELQSTFVLISSATGGAPVKTMRPPFGAQNTTVRRVCEKLGYRILLWDVDTEDWKGRPTEQIVNTILKGTGDGSIILMHDRKHRGKSTVIEATRQVVPALRAKGYTFVTVSELLATPKRHTGASPAAPIVTPTPPVAAQ